MQSQNYHIKKVVSISNWYYFFRVLISIFSYLLFFIFFWMLFGIVFSENDLLAVQVSLAVSGISSVIILIGYSLYWMQSGIYITQEGDHIVRWGGWIAKEDKLLNGIIVANQVERGPVDQLLNMATLSSGIFGHRKLVGVKYSDIKNYDAAMRSGSSHKFTSIV